MEYPGAAYDPSCTGSDRLGTIGKCLFAALSLCSLCQPRKLVQAASPVWAEGTQGQAGSQGRNNFLKLELASSEKIRPGSPILSTQGC